MEVKKAVLILIITIMISGVSFSQTRDFVPKNFQVPDTLENEHIRIRMLTIHDVVKDYDAVMTSIDHLQGVFGPTSSWPAKDLTLEQDLIDLAWHHKEFQRRSSFAYTVVALDESQVIGCLYIYPTTKLDYEATVTMWVRSSVLDQGMDDILYSTVKKWLEEEWPFNKVAYPGREISWEAWDLLEESR